MAPNNPFARLPEVPAFNVTSATVENGRPWAAAQLSGIFGMPGGADISPALAWSGAPAETRSFAVTVYDPDAPTGSGFWHWAVANIPPDISTLPESAGNENGTDLPAGAFQLPNDARMPRYVGGAPPPGHGEHRYFVTVHALDIDDIGVSPDSTPAYLGFTMASHILARATLIATAETPAV
jgi:Raf kinase inhibitor-like YbhB/YbcL family protein